MTEVVDRIDVPFHGDGCGVAELTWGQQAMYQAMERERSWLPMGGRRPVAPGTTVADVAEELRYTVSRYQSIRTRLRFDADGRPSQAIAESGTVVLEVVDAGETDPELVAAEVEHRYRTAWPDLAIEWPVRMAVVCRRGIPRQLVVIMPHLVTDGIGAAVMISEVANRVSVPVTGLQPLDLVHWQRSPAGQRQNAAALRHWERHLRNLDPQIFGPWAATAGALDEPQPRYRKATFTSPALALAAPAVAARTGVDAATVLLTAFMIALSRVTGATPVAVRHVVSNRFRVGLADVVSPITQLGLCVADVAGSFDETLQKIGRAALAAHKHAYYNPLQLADLYARIAAERALDVTRVGCFNDRRTVRRDDLGPPADAARVAAALPDSVFEWTAPPDGSTEPLFIHVDDAPGALVLTVDVDTQYLSPADAEACARGMEAAAVAATR